jgi:hypothetical protein
MAMCLVYYLCFFFWLIEFIKEKTHSPSIYNILPLSSHVNRESLEIMMLIRKEEEY